MHVDVRNVRGVIIVDLAGRLVAGTGDEILREVMNELLAADWKQILLNLSAVSRIDSAGIGELVTGIKLAERFETTVKLLLTGGKVRDVLELSQILPLLDVFEDEQEALESFQVDRPGAD
ncbi:MAG: STAS domain-containing protein [bacterium]|nr:STAS domain-containing protein [bacterium]